MTNHLASFETSATVRVNIKFRSTILRQSDKRLKLDFPHCVTNRYYTIIIRGKLCLNKWSSIMIFADYNGF
jgi:hypothetical protein